MKLFRRTREKAKPADVTALSSALAASKTPREISLSPEQKSLLEGPIDPRVDRILEQIYKDKATAENALSARRIIDFPCSDSGERHVVQDEQGFWRIVPGAPPTLLNEFFDAL